MPLMPAFHRRPEESKILSRILAGYGELEFMLGMCLGRVVEDEKVAFRTIFRIRGEQNRLIIANSLMEKAFHTIGLGNEYVEGMNAIEFCRILRNQYAHAHWDDHKTAGLFFTNMEKTTKGSDAKTDAPFKHEWNHTDVLLLEKQEAYFFYTMEVLQHLNFEYGFRAGKLRGSFFPMPSKMDQPLRYNPPELHPPPWTDLAS